MTVLSSGKNNQVHPQVNLLEFIKQSVRSGETKAECRLVVLAFLMQYSCPQEWV